MDEGGHKDFGLKLKANQVCPKHRDRAIEFYCTIGNHFYCRQCAKDHNGHDDEAIAQNMFEIQN